MEREEKPVADSYWIIPGRFMAGEYPSSRDERVARKKILWLIQNGLNYFIDLTEPGEYDLSPYQRYLIEEEKSTGFQISHQRFPIADRQIPTHERMLDILDAIDNALNTDRNIYLHCYGGIGRTGTVVGCYLVRHGMEGNQALEQIDRWRLETPSGRQISPETFLQRSMILNWKG